jgi:hypothetical protein
MTGHFGLLRLKINFRGHLNNLCHGCESLMCYNLVTKRFRAPPGGGDNGAAGWCSSRCGNSRRVRVIFERELAPKVLDGSLLSFKRARERELVS